MGTREEAIDDLILALIYLTRFNDREGIPFNEMAWKNYDFDATYKTFNDALVKVTSMLNQITYPEQISLLAKAQTIQKKMDIREFLLF